MNRLKGIISNKTLQAIINTLVAFSISKALEEVIMRISDHIQRVIFLPNYLCYNLNGLRLVYQYT